MACLATWGKTTVSAAQIRLTFHRIWLCGQMRQLFAEGQSVHLQLQPVLGMGDRNLKTLRQRFDMRLRISDMGPFFAFCKWSRDFFVRHLRLKNSIEQRHVEWATLGKTTVSAVQIVLLSTEFGAECVKHLLEGQSVQLWQCLRTDESSATYPRDGRCKLENTPPTFWHENQRHEIQTSDMRPFFKWTTACEPLPKRL